MTQQDDITQRLRDNADLDEAEHGNARVVQLEREAADEIERLRAELSKLRAPVADERRLRRMLCAQYAGSLAYMDDGEAQDARAMPVIDFLRDSIDEIERKMRMRADAALASAPVAGGGRAASGTSTTRERMQAMHGRC